MAYVKVNYSSVIVHPGIHSFDQYAVEVSLGCAARCYLSEPQARELIGRLEDAVNSSEIARKARNQ